MIARFACVHVSHLSVDPKKLDFPGTALEFRYRFVACHLPFLKVE